MTKLSSPILPSGSFRKLAAQSTAAARPRHANAAFAILLAPVTQRQWRGPLIETANDAIFLQGSRRRSGAERRDFRFNRVGTNLRHLVQNAKQRPLAQPVLV